MRGVATDIGTIHFVGIGGMGMSGLAEVMHNLGYRVQGSDIIDTPIVESLRKRGIAIAIGHSEKNVEDAAVVVVSTAIQSSNPEIEAALAQRIPLVRRAEMLAELMRLKLTVAVAGTHGKTTTTSMIAALLDAGGIDPTVINGGVINHYDSTSRLGASEWMVIEADESDGSFLRLDGTIAVVTNIDPEHLDYWGDFDAVKNGFVEFIENVPFYGAAVVCIDHPQVQTIIPRIRGRRLVTYGFSAQADVRAHNLQPLVSGTRFDVTVRERNKTGYEERHIYEIELPMPGKHNVQNALAAIAVALQLHVDDAAILEGFAGFAGVKRRFSTIDKIACQGGTVTVIDDYAHHPVEIRAALSGARETVTLTVPPGRIIAVVQPHRFSRLANMMDDFASAFNDADQIIALPVYAAGEEEIEGITSQALVGALRAHGHHDAHALGGGGELAEQLAGEILAGRLRGGDLIVCLGAGDITKIAAGLGKAVAAAVHRTAQPTQTQTASTQTTYAKASTDAIHEAKA